MDFIRHAMKSKGKSATERLHDDYRKMFKSQPLIYIVTNNLQLYAMEIISLFERFKSVEVNYFI